MFGLVRVEQGD